MEVKEKQNQQGLKENVIDKNKRGGGFYPPPLKEFPFVESYFTTVSLLENVPSGVETLIK